MSNTSSQITENAVRALAAGVTPEAFMNSLCAEDIRTLGVEGLEIMVTEEMLIQLRDRAAIKVADMSPEDRKMHFSIISNIALSLNTGSDNGFCSDR